MTGRVGDDLRDGELRRADQWGIGSEPAGGDIRDVTRGIECARRGSFEDGFLQEWEERVIEPAEHYQLRVEDVDQVADSQAEPSTDLGEGIQSLLVAGIRPRNDCANEASPVTLDGMPARRASAASPASVSQQPIAPQRQVWPSGLIRVCPASPA